MRYRLAVMILLMLLNMLPVMNVLAAPAPKPASAILDIGPPPKDLSAEEHCKKEIDNLKYYDDIFFHACNIDPDFRNLPAVARLKGSARPWLAKNLQVKEEAGGRRLRLVCLSGSRAEQVIVLNALLRAYLKMKKRRIKYFEECISTHEKRIIQLEQRILKEEDGDRVERYRMKIDDLRSKQIPECRAEIDHLNQFTVTEWAKK